MLQHRVYVDDWSLLEKLCLVSAVQRFGENWASICEYIKPKLQEERQWDWFTAETCEAQYKQLYNENVKSSENPLQQIIQSLKSRCRIEGQPLEEQKNKYLTLKKILETIAKNEIGEDQLDKYYEKALQAKKDREENRRRFQELLKKRDLAKIEYEKIDSTRSPNKSDPKTDASSPVTTSPLLSSLLNNPPAVQYRPTLTTSSFIQTKVPQNQSSSPGRQASSPGRQASSPGRQVSSPGRQSNSPGRQSNLFSSSPSTARRLSFPDPVGSPTSDSRSMLAKDSRSPRETTPAPEVLAKIDAQNLENLVLISPNEEYLSEVDIPQETLQEVIDNLKEGTISLDKIIRDLEAGTDESIMSKDDLASVDVEETYVEVTEDVKPPESIIESQPCSEIITLNDDAVCCISPNTIHIPTDGAFAQADTMIVDQSSPIEEPSIIVSSQDDVPSVSSSLKNIESESATSDLSNIILSIESSPRATADANIETESVQSRVSSPSIEIESPKPNVEPPQQFHVEESIATVPQLQEVDLTIEDSQLSGDGVVTCDSISEVEEPVENVEDDQEPPVLSKIDEEFESQPCENGYDDGADKLSTENEAEPADVVEIDEPSPIVIKVPQPEPEIPAEMLENSVTMVEVDEVQDLNDSNSQVVADSQPPPLNHMITEDTAVEQAESNAPVTPVKRRFSISLRRSETPVPLEEEQHPLESTPHEVSKPGDEPPQLQPQLPTENRGLIADIMRHILKTPDKDSVDSSDEDAIKNRSTARRQSRRRKSTSESDEVVSAPKVPDSSEEEEPTGEKELNITIQDLRDTLDPSLEAEILEPKEEPVEKELVIEVEMKSITEKSESNSSSEPKRPAKSKRSSARTRSPAIKLDSTPASSPGSSDDSELARTRRKSILLAYSRLVSHKYSTAFQKPISSKQVPGYDSIIYNPMDLHTMKRRIDNRQITTVAEFQRDVLLMLNNAKMFNQVNSQVYNMAVEVEKDTLDHLKITVQALGEGILRRDEKTNAEKIRKRQSLDIARRESKSVKRMKSISKDDIVPIKKIKLEENEDSETPT